MDKKHVFFYSLFRPLVVLFLKIKFGYKFQKAEGLPENYIVLSNHVTDFDPLFVAASFKKQMYFVGSEHIARWNLAYKFLKYCFAPIVRYKGTVAASTVMEILKKVRKGANVCVFAEGVRTWDGVTSPILPSTAKLIKAAKCGLVTYKITGGYFVSPMWSGFNTRRGYIEGAPVKIYTKEQLALMSQNEIYEIIKNDLYEDAYERQLVSPKRYKGKGLAERMEHLLFKCPECGKYDTFHSEGNTVKCTSCGMSFTYDEYGMLDGIPFKTVKELSDWQKQCVKEDVENCCHYLAAGGQISTVSNHIETKLDEGPVIMSTESLKCGNTEIFLKDILDLAMHGKRAIVFSTNEKYYELIPQEGINSLKFFLYYNACKSYACKKEA